jgi:hypothetical protein
MVEAIAVAFRKRRRFMLTEEAGGRLEFDLFMFNL